VSQNFKEWQSNLILEIFYNEVRGYLFKKLIDASHCHFNTTFEHDIEARASTMQNEILF